MRSVSSWVDYLIMGGGAAMAFVLVLLIFFDVRLFPPEGSEMLVYVMEDAPWLGLVPLFALMYMGGMIQDRIAYLLFRPWEQNLRKYAIAPDENGEPQREHYYRVRSFFFTSPGTRAMVDRYFHNRARLRLFRAWSVNALMITGLLAYREQTHAYFHPYIFPTLLIFGLLALGCILGWYVATVSEHKVLNQFNAEMMGIQS